MEAVTETQKRQSPTVIALILLFKLLSGPLCLLIVYSIEVEGMVHGSKIALGTLAWMVAWWILQPAPWGITALLPLVIFPLTGTLGITDTTSLYGQRVFFWIMGVTLLALAVIKHGLAKRFALAFLTLPGVGDSTGRLLFVFMLATACVSMFVSDGSAVAIMIPIGLSIHAYIVTLSRQNASGNEAPRLRAFIALGTLYAAVSGGIATMIGMPHSAVAMAQLEALTGSSIGWFSWMMVGVPIFAVLLVCNYFLLRFFFKPEIGIIPGGRDFLLREQRKLGKMTSGEKSVLFIFLFMAMLFILPPLLPNILGEENAFSLWLSNAISIWVVPPIVLLLLFTVPSNLKEREFVLNWKEASARIPWEILLMVTSAVAVVQTLAAFGFTDLVAQNIAKASHSAVGLPYLTGIATAISTNLMSGVAAAALLTAVMVPVAEQVGFNPAAITIMVPATAMGIIFPWAGATVGTAFAIGQIELRDLIRIGILAEIIMIAVAGTFCLIFAPFL
ncbi:MAG: SLC13 family permease [Gammaproteobacteria bacterium]